MIYCASCGSPNPAGQFVCEVCGAELPAAGSTTPPPPSSPWSAPQPAPASASPPGSAPASDALSGSEQFGLFIGTFCLSPLLGVVLYYMWRERHPARARQACTLTRWAVALWVGFFVLGVMAGIVSEL